MFYVLRLVLVFLQFEVFNGFESKGNGFRVRVRVRVWECDGDGFIGGTIRIGFYFVVSRHGHGDRGLDASTAFCDFKGLFLGGCCFHSFSFGGSVSLLLVTSQQSPSLSSFSLSPHRNTFHTCSDENRVLWLWLNSPYV